MWRLSRGLIDKLDSLDGLDRRGGIKLLLAALEKSKLILSEFKVLRNKLPPLLVSDSRYSCAESSVNVAPLRGTIDKLLDRRGGVIKALQIEVQTGCEEQRWLPAGKQQIGERNLEILKSITDRTRKMCRKRSSIVRWFCTEKATPVHTGVAYLASFFTSV